MGVGLCAVWGYTSVRTSIPVQWRARPARGGREPSVGMSDSPPQHCPCPPRASVGLNPTRVGRPSERPTSRSHHAAKTPGCGPATPGTRPRLVCPFWALKSQGTAHNRDLNGCRIKVHCDPGSGFWSQGEVPITGHDHQPDLLPRRNDLVIRL